MVLLDHKSNFLAAIIALFKYKRYVETSKKAQIVLDESTKRLQDIGKK